MNRRSRWQWVVGTIALASGFATLFMFTTGYQSIPELLGWSRGAVDDTPADPARSNKDGLQRTPPPEPPRPLDLEAESENGARFPVRVELERVIRREADTLVRLALTSSASENLEYLLHAFNRQQPRLGGRDGFFLTDASGARHDWSGQQGATETMRTDMIGSLCLTLPSATRQTFDLVFPTGPIRGDVTLLHVRSPKIFSHVKCPDAKSVTLPNFTLQTTIP